MMHLVRHTETSVKLSLKSRVILVCLETEDHMVFQCGVLFVFCLQIGCM